MNLFEAKVREIRGKAYPEEFKDFPAREATAHDVFNYEHSVFPGLIQTEWYMPAVFEAVRGITAEDIEQRVAGRMARQEILYRKSPAPPRFWALMDEAALRRPVADPAVMHEQCMFALEVSRLPHVSLAVVPYTARWHVGLLRACHIVEQDGIPCVVSLDDLADGRLSEDPVIVRRVALRFRVLQHEALSGGDSRDMIAWVAEELWKGPTRAGARALTAVGTVEDA